MLDAYKTFESSSEFRNGWERQSFRKLALAFVLTAGLALLAVSSRLFLSSLLEEPVLSFSICLLLFLLFAYFLRRHYLHQMHQMTLAHKITEQKKAEQRIEQLTRELTDRNFELEAEKKYWQAVVEGIAEEIWISDANGKMSLINLASVTTMGLKPFKNKIVYEVLEEVEIFNLDGQLRRPEDAPLLRSLRGEIVRGEEIMRHRQTGRTRYRHFSSSPLRNQYGEITGAVSVNRDITEEKMMEKQLQKAKQAAEAANQAKSHFLAVMSHELRTPLTAILGFSELLTQTDLNPQDRADFISRIRRNGEQLTKLIGEILDLSKIEAEKLELESIEVNLSEVISDVMGVLSRLAQQKGLSLDLEFKDPLPDSVLLDPTRFRQVLTNVIGNAIKFTEKGSVHVTVGIKPEEEKIDFRVKDTGEGIEAAKAEKLFEPFVQADSSDTRRYGGTGLGLHLSRKLARAMGGDVQLLECVPGQGCTFQILFRLQNPKYDRAANKEISHPSSSKIQPVYNLKGIRILVVDDAIDNQLLLERMLEGVGAEVEVASDGAEGLEKALKDRFDIVLMDMQMPRMDGYEATKLLRAGGYKSPILALTANVMGWERDKTFSSGCNEYISKPITKLSLFSAISKFLP